MTKLSFSLKYHESRVPTMTSDDVGATPQREASSESRKEECSTLARLREMGVSFVNKEDLIDNSKRLVNKTVKCPTPSKCGGDKQYSKPHHYF